MSKEMFMRLSPRGKRRALVVAGLKALFDMAVVGGFFYGACYVVHLLQMWAGVA